VTFQIDVAHTGAQPCDQLTLPLVERWSRDLGTRLSFPLVAGGRVFLLLEAVFNVSGAAVVALDEATGAILWGPTTVSTSSDSAGFAYDSGRVFVVDGNGAKTAFDAATGNVLWSLGSPAGYFNFSTPLAINGRLFALDGYYGGFRAFDEGNGAEIWLATTGAGSGSPPALGYGNLFALSECQLDAVSPDVGQKLWRNSWCSGGNSLAAAIARGAVYTRYSGTDLGTLSNKIIDARTGAQLGTFGAAAWTFSPAPIPAFSADSNIYTAHDVQSVALDGGVQWTFDGGLGVPMAPLSVGPDVVFATSDATLWVVDGHTGAVVSSAAIPGWDGGGAGVDSTGLAAADGLLFVPAGTTLVAY
jgi:outer membrane protein assembly factor BamB